METLIAALITLGVTIIGSLGYLIKVYTKHLTDELKANTQITTQARDLSNGRLSEALDRLAAERNRTLGLRYLVRERDNRIAYIISRHPDVEHTLSQYLSSNDHRLTNADEVAAERRVIGDQDSMK